MMQRNKVSLERQFDDRLYQFISPFEGNWNEIEVVVLEIAKIARSNIEASEKKAAEEKASAEMVQVEAPKE